MKDLYERVQESADELKVSKRDMLTAYQVSVRSVNDKYGFNSEKYGQGNDVMKNFMQFKDERVFRYARALMYQKSKEVR